MTTMRIKIVLRSDDYRVLDRSTAKLIADIPENEVQDIQVQILDSFTVEKNRFMGRRITLVNPTSKGIKVLETLDFPHNVDIFITS